MTMHKVAFMLAIVLWLVSASFARAELVVHLPLDAESGDLLPPGGHQFVQGVVGNALALDAHRRGVAIKGVTLAMKRSETLSVGCWFRATGPLGDDFAVVSGGGVRLSVGGEGHPHVIARGLRCVFHGVTAAKGAEGYTNVCDGRWHYLLAVYDGQSLSLYADGAMEDTVDATGRITPDSGAVTLGNFSHTSSEPAGKTLCSIDEVRVYDTAVRWATIAALFGKKASPAAPVDCRKLDLHGDFLDVGVAPIQAHRGGGVTMPEHTLETYLDTWNRGMIPEVDMRTTKDGVIICVHDDDPKRVCPDAPEPLRDRTFDQMTLAEVKRLDVGKWRGRPGQEIPTLEEVFAQMRDRPERKLEMDYKDVSFARLAELVSQYGLRDQAFFVARRHDLIRRWQQLVPRSVTMLWMGGSEHVLAKRFEQLRRDDFAGISILQIIVIKDPRADDGFKPSLAFLHARQQELGRRGIALQLIPWKTSNRAVFEKLVANGFRFFGTDYPQAALDAYRAVTRPSHPDK